ncbi:MAG TPA: CAP domain-containing protein [Oscillospiraceae bacterium]|nr:CAP domain-containing protein [Oscillospiraceae bacterium]
MRKIVIFIAICLIFIATSTSCTQSMSLSSDENKISDSDTQISSESLTQTLEFSETTIAVSEPETSSIATTSPVTIISEINTTTSVPLTTIQPVKAAMVTSTTIVPVTTTTAAPVTTAVPAATSAPVTTTAVTTAKTEVKLITPEKLKPLADEIFRLTNEERKKAGVTEFKSYTLLSNAAQIRADECSKNKTLEHKRPDGRPCDTVLDELNLKAKCSWWGENAAYCSTEPTAEFIVGTWMKSQGHKDNMLMSRYTHVGIGVSVADNGAYYFIQVFAQQKKNTDWQ